jgi:hypothetical protein
LVCVCRSFSIFFCVFSVCWSSSSMGSAVFTSVT